MELFHTLACFVCMGGDDHETTAAGYAILFLLIVIACVLGCVVRFMFYLNKQAKTSENELEELPQI